MFQTTNQTRIWAAKRESKKCTCHRQKSAEICVSSHEKSGCFHLLSWVHGHVRIACLPRLFPLNWSTPAGDMGGLGYHFCAHPCGPENGWLWHPWPTRFHLFRRSCSPLQPRGFLWQPPYPMVCRYFPYSFYKWRCSWYILVSPP